MPEGESEVVLLSGAGLQLKTVTIYLPLRHRVEILEWGIDTEASCATLPAFSQESLLVFYGSSVCQGIGAARPGMSYASVLGRLLDLDFVNLGFGGAGKAEPEVIERVTAANASAFLLDLGKSYGRQDTDPYVQMLQTIRKAHPVTPIVCVTPIFSSREICEPDYRELSAHTRTVVREAVTRAADDGVTLVEGESLLGPSDADGLSGDGLHPSDLGHTMIAERLAPIVREIL